MDSQSQTANTVQPKMQNGLTERGHSSVVSTDFTCNSSVRGAGHSPLEACSSPAAMAFASDPAAFAVEPPKPRQQEDALRYVGLQLRDAGDGVNSLYTGGKVESTRPTPIVTSRPSPAGRQLAEIADKLQTEQQWKNASSAASDFVHAVAAAAVAGFLTGLVVESFLL